MWNYAAPTSQNSSARGVGKTYANKCVFFTLKTSPKHPDFTAFLFKKVRAPFRGHYSVLMYSIRSDGWQSSTSQILSSASTGKCLTELLQIAEIVGGRMPVLSAKSFWVISRIASITFTLNFIIIFPPFVGMIVLDIITRFLLSVNTKCEK